MYRIIEKDGQERWIVVKQGVLLSNDSYEEGTAEVSDIVRDMRSRHQLSQEMGESRCIGQIHQLHLYVLIGGEEEPLQLRQPNFVFLQHRKPLIRVIKNY
jgi:hypothetical protein